MRTLLAIDVSPRCDYSTTRKLTALFVDKWREAHSGGYVVERDLVKTNLPFVDLPWIGGAFTPPEPLPDPNPATVQTALTLDRGGVTSATGRSHFARILWQSSPLQ